MHIESYAEHTRQEREEGERMREREGEKSILYERERCTLLL
jgi:hypothetical protein